MPQRTKGSSSRMQKLKKYQAQRSRVEKQLKQRLGERATAFCSGISQAQSSPYSWRQDTWEAVEVSSLGSQGLCPRGLRGTEQSSLVGTVPGGVCRWADVAVASNPPPEGSRSALSPYGLVSSQSGLLPEEGGEGQAGCPVPRACPSWG